MDVRAVFECSVVLDFASSSIDGMEEALRVRLSGDGLEGGSGFGEMVGEDSSERIEIPLIEEAALMVVSLTLSSPEGLSNVITGLAALAVKEGDRMYLGGDAGAIRGGVSLNGIMVFCGIKSVSDVPLILVSVEILFEMLIGSDPVCVIS